MTPEQKFERMADPHTLEDYGLSMDEAELETFDDGRKVLECLREETKRHERNVEIIKRTGLRINEAIEHKIYGAIIATALRR